MDEENIYSKVPDALIQPLRETLPPLAEATNELYERRIELPDFGRLVVTFKKFTHKHHKSTHTFWTIQRVVKAKDCNHESDNEQSEDEDPGR